MSNYDLQYTIQSGDSLWDIADGFNTTAESIVEANPGIDPYNLPVGQIISIPDDLQTVYAEQFRGVRPGFRPGFRRPFVPFRPPFRRFRPIFRPPVIIAPIPITPFPCSPWDPFCQWDQY